VRKRLAGFVNASPDEIALTHSTTEGLNLFAHGLDWKPGDEVLLGTQEHFSAHEAYLWVEKRYGARIVWVDVPAAPESVEQVVALYAKAITPRTKVVVLRRGRLHLRVVLAAEGTLRSRPQPRSAGFVDGAQAFGVVPLDVKAIGADHYAAPGQNGCWPARAPAFRTSARMCRSRSGRSRAMSMRKDRAARARLPAIVTSAAGR